MTKTMMLTLFCCAGLVGCMKNTVGEKPIVGREINLKAGLNAVVGGSSKAPVETGGEFVASVVGWEVSGSTPDYASAPKWYSTAQIAATADVSQVVLVPEQLYNENTAIKTHIKAWYPVGGDVVGGQVTFADNVKDGLTDVLFADGVWATAVIAPSSALHFKHMLTQLKFEVVGDDGYAALGNKVTSIVIKNVELPTGIDVVSNEVLYQAALNLALPEVAAEGVAIGTVETRVGQAAMVRPFGGNNFLIDVITTQATYSDVRVTIADDPQFVTGRAYRITLRFAGSRVTAGSSVEQWTDGKGGADVME